MKQRRSWLKMIGAADWPLVDKWIEERPDLLRRVRGPKQPSGIQRGDRLVYYSAVSQKIFAIARSSINGDEAPVYLASGEHRWPYVLDVQVLLAIPTLALAPDWKVLEMPSTAVMQKPYVELTDDQYRKAVDAITERVRS